MNYEKQLNYELVQKSSSCDCGITKDGLAQVCETHYSEHCQYPMETSLITTKDEGKKIFKKFEIELSNVNKN